MKAFKKIITITAVIVVFISSAFLGLWSRKKITHYRELKEEVQDLRYLKEKENRIKSMEQTLMVQYKLSWYEAHYYSIIMDDFSQRDSIPWQIYAAMIRIESNFNPTGVSSKGARGMTQVIEPTGKSVAKELGIPYKEKMTLWNDIVNMVIGFHYLGQNIKKMGLEDGIKAYIGGPGFKKGRKDIRRYRTTVQWEFERLQYIHAGIMNGDYDFHGAVNGDR